MVLLAAELSLLSRAEVPPFWGILRVLWAREMAHVAGEAEKWQRWLPEDDGRLVLEVFSRVKQLEDCLGQARPRDGHVGALMVAEHGATGACGATEGSVWPLAAGADSLLLLRAC